MPHITGARAAGRDTAAACWLMVRRGYCKDPAGLADCCSGRTLQLKCCFAREAATRLAAEQPETAAASGQRQSRPWL
jgi:hypothetical protein